ncbi:carboxypeptidase-like regulatory domain-containing protein [Adhaeribacter terreus]|uniref:Carboxypeptidase-like regulatory domain-containing protein n=1 Tax=Adhaeribacter terreus TaxID=529703 RepID=A0ABW0E9I2_9BACT
MLLAVPVAFAQQKVLNGRVLDTKTALPIEGAVIQFSNAEKAIATDAKGSFSLPIDTVFAGQMLIISHLGYEKFTLKLKPGQANITVSLTPKTNTLSEVRITASKKLKPAKVRPETVLDFGITNDRLFVLGWETGQKNPTLQVLNLYNDSLLMNCRLPVYAEKLYVDCLENLHLLTANHAFQIYLDSVSLALYPPETKATFEQHLFPCLTTDNENAYFRRNINKGIIVSFYTVNRQSHETKLFRMVADEAVLTMQQSEARFQFFRSGQNGADPEMNMNRTAHTLENNIAFAQKVMFEAPYVPLLKIGKEICLFDHVNGEIEFYERDSLRRVLPVNYHLQPNWDKQILIDAPQEKAYVLFRKNGLPELRLLDLQTGELLSTYKLGHPFAEKISVHNGQVYFLYKDPAKNFRQFLYKAPLNALQN